MKSQASLVRTAKSKSFDSDSGMTPSHQSGRSANSPRPSISLAWLTAGVVIASGLTFALGLADKPFVDEYAYISQSYFADLFLEGRTNDPEWLELRAYDLQPLPKYLIGVGLRAARLPMPGPANAHAWYYDKEHPYHPFGGASTLLVGRLPTIVLGVIGCVAILACGILIRDRKTGVVAALLLVASPLYRLHAHRAMSDVPCEALTLVALAVALWTGQRIWRGGGAGVYLVGVITAGLASGLAILCKFNGFLTLMVLAVWSAVVLVSPGVSLARRLLIATGPILSTAVAFTALVVLNPFLTAHPTGTHGPTRILASYGIVERLRFQFRHRFALSDSQKRTFTGDALNDPLDKAKVFWVQGFGRFGPLGPSVSNSVNRYEWRQDAGAIIWAPIVLLGVVLAARLVVVQRRARVYPRALFLLAYAGAAWGVVAYYLPMAWDRYLLPIQAPATLLAAVAATSLWDWLDITSRSAVSRPIHRAAAGVFLIVLGSDAYFWHSRDWNTASRLMLVYSIVDRGTIDITGLEQQTGDRALYQGRYYSDKLPGYPLLAAPAYGMAKAMLGLPSHPLNGPALRYWWADYWVTLLTSGLFTAAAAALIVVWSGELGCRPAVAAILGLAYGLGTPAYVYATLAYGHQATALALLGSLYLIVRPAGARSSRFRWLAAGGLASVAAVVELQVAPVSAILATVLLARCLIRKAPWDALSLFALGATAPLLVMLGYNQLAFGSPFDMGYFHHANPEFALVHGRGHPLGLTSPDWSKLVPLLVGEHRGLTFYAPIVWLAIPGWIALGSRGYRELALATAACAIAVLLVNLSYPEWTGGWSTGPRLLTPLLPFAVLPVAALLAGDTPRSRAAVWIAVSLGIAGGVLMLLFQGVGGRVPHDIPHPTREALWPIWTGANPIPGWRFDERFSQNLCSLVAGTGLARLSSTVQFVQFLPLVIAQVVSIAMLMRWLRPPPSVAGDPTIGSFPDPGSEP